MKPFFSNRLMLFDSDDIVSTQEYKCMYDNSSFRKKRSVSLLLSYLNQYDVRRRNCLKKQKQNKNTNLNPPPPSAHSYTDRDQRAHCLTYINVEHLTMKNNTTEVNKKH